MSDENGLLELRNQLDTIDNKLLDLINERMQIVHKVGALKAKSGGAIYRPEREKAIIAEHQRTLENLEKQSRDLDLKKDREKRAVSQILSRLMFYKKRNEQEEQRAEQVRQQGQNQLAGVEASLRQFTQEVTVLENKIRSLRTLTK